MTSDNSKTEARGIDSPMAPPEQPPYCQSAEQVLAALGSRLAEGLAAEEAARRLAHAGPNELHEAPPEATWKKFLAQFKELVVGILLVAALISLLTKDYPDAFAILAIVMLNATLGFLQEARAEKALAALRKLSAPTARVIRDGQIRTLPAAELVPGDRVELEAGDNVPADVRLVESFGLKVQEASLTGESAPVEKVAGATLPAETSLADRANMAYMGTVVAAGKAKAVVTATGMQTELGRIAGMLRIEQHVVTPLQRRLGELGRVLVVGCLAIVAVVFALELWRERALYTVFLRAVSLAVAAVPEGLPAVVTMALALGLRRMVARNVLIRRLPSVETLGSVTVICSDKTGTLTRNEMTVRSVYAGGRLYRVTGIGYAPEGQFVPAEFPSGSAVGGEPLDPDLALALLVGARCNNAQVVPGAQSGVWQVVGDPTEGALLVAAMKARVEPLGPQERILFEIPFDSDRKAMSVVVGGRGRSPIMYTKGAPEVLLPRCTTERREGANHPLDDARRAEILEAAGAMARQALRVLALSCREYPENTPPDQFVEQNLVFAGLAGMIDPPRTEVKAAIATCRAAGIRPVMITGDHPTTAAAVAAELGLAAEARQTIDGRAVDALNDQALAARVEGLAVYARVSPEHKLRVVRAWQARGQVVAMTGDGVNDAPAVKAADIGVAMGRTGTDVTKEASDMVLIDDNFTSIVNAVEEGRGIFDNIQKFIHYLLSCNAGEVMLMFAAALIGWPAPLEAIQILWINLVTDGLPALALGMEAPERDVMQRPPRPPREPVITLRRGLRILRHGALIAASAGAGFAFVLGDGQEHAQERARTVAFCVMAFSQLFFSVSCRSATRTLPELGLFTNLHLVGAIVFSGLLQLAVVTLPFAQNVFETASNLSYEWAVIALLALLPVTLVETAKIGSAWLFRRRAGSATLTSETS